MTVSSWFHGLWSNHYRLLEDSHKARPDLGMLSDQRGGIRASTLGIWSKRDWRSVFAQAADGVGAAH